MTNRHEGAATVAAPRVTADVRRLHALVDALPMALALCDEQGRLLHANRAYVELAECEGPDANDGDLAEAFPEASELLAPAIAATLRGERVPPVRATIVRASGRRVIEFTLLPLDPDSASLGFAFLAADVTEREELREDLAEQVRLGHALYARVASEQARVDRMVAERAERLRREEAARARDRRLAAVGQLAAGVMHDVNNALNPILAAAHLLKLRANDPAAVRDYADRIAKAAETGAATAARVGRFIRQEPRDGYDDTVDLSAVAEEVLAMTRSLWDEHPRGGRITIERALEPGVIVRGMAGELREALLNLVHNAFDAMRERGGTLTITTRSSDDEGLLEVRDTGIGMSAETAERAFEPFFTTKRGEGMGLGLSEVWGIMKRHRGRAELESALGVGTLVRLRFPLARAMAAREHAGALPAVQRKILVVEDNLDNRDFMCALLRAEGHLVESAVGVADAAELLAAVQESDRPFDVLVTDIGLRDGSGWELVATVRARWPGVRVGVVTGWEREPGSEDDAEARPPVDFTLRKPVRTDELLARLGASA